MAENKGLFEEAAKLYDLAKVQCALPPSALNGSVLLGVTRTDIWGWGGAHPLPRHTPCCLGICGPIRVIVCSTELFLPETYF